jgi:hypothetical protein
MTSIENPRNLRFKFVACLKKQSQFAGGQIGVSSYTKGDYEEIATAWARKNKAKQSQFISVQRSECCGLRMDSRRNLCLRKQVQE